MKKGSNLEPLHYNSGMNMLTVSLAQVQIFQGELDRMVRRGFEMIEIAATEQSDLILFPELWTSGYDLRNMERYAQFHQQELFPLLAAEAARLKIFIGGSYLTKRENGFYNTFMLFPSDQSEPAQYDKIHLFRLMREDRYLQPGNELVAASAPWGKTGLAVCYDLRFPELFRQHSAEGCRTCLLSAEWPQSRTEHWDTLLRARAIENQMVVIAANVVGATRKETFGGISSVYSAWGDCLLRTGAEEGLFTLEVDLSEVDRVRDQYPFLADR